jgi:acetyl-CoA acyltransferase
MTNAYIIDAIRTPFGRYGGELAQLRSDDLGALPIQALMARNPSVRWDQVDDVILGCANQAGEDNRNVARMSALLAGLPHQVPATTVNRLCGSSLDALAIAARAIKAGEAELIIAGGVENMSRAPYVMGKADAAFARSQKIEDTTMGWRFINPKLKALYGVDSMPQTAENVAEQFGINRADQDLFALRSQQRTAAAQAAGFFEREMIPVEIVRAKGQTSLLTQDEHPRASSRMEP